jgi:sulfite reductase (ferredoxin)
MADKVIKVPTKRAPEAVRVLLNDYEANSLDGEYFNDYYVRNGKDYFYNMLKFLKETDNLVAGDFMDWGSEKKYKVEIGIGECAGVVLDLVATLLYDAKEKLNNAKLAIDSGDLANGIYHTYSFYINTAKALLLDKKIKCNTQTSIIDDFDANYVATGEFKFESGFRTHLLQINKNAPSKEFAEHYFKEAINFSELTKAFSDARIESAKVD